MFEIPERLDEAEEVALIERVSPDEVSVVVAERKKVNELVPAVSEADTGVVIAPVSVGYGESLGDERSVGVKVREPAEKVPVFDCVAEYRELERDCVAVRESVEVSRERVLDGVGKGETLGLLELLALRESETSSLRLALFESVPDTCPLRELGSEFEKVALIERVPPDEVGVAEVEREKVNELDPTVSEDDTVVVIVLVEGRLFESL